LELLDRGFAWLDIRNHDLLIKAGHFVQTIEHRKGLNVACLEDIAYNNDWWDERAIKRKADTLYNTSYGQYLAGLV